jgi:hypothetical protein
MSLERRVELEWVDPRMSWQEKPNTIYGIWMDNSKYSDVYEFLKSTPQEQREKMIVAGWLNSLDPGQHHALRMLGVGRYDTSVGEVDGDVPWQHQVADIILDFYKEHGRLPG